MALIKEYLRISANRDNQHLNFEIAGLPIEA